MAENISEIPADMRFLVERQDSQDTIFIVLGAKLGRDFGKSKGKTLRELYIEALRAKTTEECASKFDEAREVLNKIHKGARK